MQNIGDTLDPAEKLVRPLAQAAEIIVKKHPRQAVQSDSADIPPHLSKLIANGVVQTPLGPRYLPTTPVKLRGPGETAAECVARGRR